MAEISGRVGWRNYVSPVPTIWNNLTHYYSADNTANDSKGSINGTLVNGATYSTGKINNGFSLDGVNDYVNVGNLFGFDGTTPFSISFIFKLNTNIANYSIKYLVGNQTRTAFPTNGTGAFLYTGDGGANNRLGFAMANNGNRLVVYIKNNLAINTFYHCVVSYNGNGLNSGLNTYINGVSEKLSVFSDSLTLPISSSSQLSTFGSTLGTSDFFNGVIDEVGVWDRALTAVDVTELYNAGAGKQYVAPTPTYPTSLKLFIDAGNPLSYPGTGTTVTDLTGTQNGTLVNGTSYSSSDGGSFVFDGVNDLITFAHNTAIKPTAKGTLSVMCKLLAPYTGVVLSTMDRNTYFKGVAIFQDGSPMRVQVANNGSRQSLNNSTSFNNVWKMITITWDGTTIKRYVNDALIDTVSQNVVPTTHTNPVTIGDMSPNDYPMKGNVSWAKIYDDAITLSDVQANFNSIKTRYGL